MVVSTCRFFHHKRSPRRESPIQRSLLECPYKAFFCSAEFLGLAAQSVDEGSVGGESVLILGVGKLSEKLLDIFLGDFVTKVSKDVLEFSEHHGSVAVFVVELEELNVVVVGSGGVRGVLGSVDLLDDLVKLGELLAFLIGLSKTNANLLGGVHSKGIHDISEEEKVEFAFAIPIVDVADFLNSLSNNHFEI